jgi:glycosyltransferase involved in cell wall biosynthesis
MISIIICSRDKKSLHDVTESVAATIGVPYELIAIDNSKSEYGICEAYNIGAKRSKYDLLCFMHEDLKFHTEGWGKNVARILADPAVGVLGVAGATYQLKAPTSWIHAGTPCLRVNVLHTTGKAVLRADYFNPQKEVIAEVATVDGLWMCCRKQVWQDFPFDQESFPFFHFYDIDFCTKIFVKYRIVVTYEILIEHFSEGTFKIDWTVNALKYFRLRKQYLPFGKTHLKDLEVKQLELKIFQQTLKNLINYKAKASDIMYCLYECIKLDLRNKDTMWIAKQYLRGKTLGKTEHLG